jgi:CelD/BcsL family acetyltransferase involved in cellulose biosynthesis
MLSTLSVQREDFVSLPEARWEQLLGASATRSVFLTHAWQRIWWEHFGAGKELHLLSVWAGGRVVGIVPLVQEGDSIGFAGGSDVSDYLDVIAAPEARAFVWEQTLEHLRGLAWRQADFRCIPAASPTVEQFAGAAARAGFLATSSSEEVCPILPLPPTWDAFLSMLSKKDRHELRRKLRRLEGAGEYRIHAPDRAQDSVGLEQDLTDFFRLHRLSRKEKAVFMTPQMEAFFRAVARHFVPLGVQKAYFMELDGVRVAAAICFDQNNNLYLYNSGYDHAYPHLSVGLLLKALCIRDAIETGKTLFDFLRGDERYKYDLGGRDVPLYHLRISRKLEEQGPGTWGVQGELPVPGPSLPYS